MVVHEFRCQLYGLVPDGKVDWVFFEEGVVFFLVGEEALTLEEVRVGEHFFAEVGEEGIEVLRGGGGEGGKGTWEWGRGG